MTTAVRRTATLLGLAAVLSVGLLGVATSGVSHATTTAMSCPIRGDRCAPYEGP